ncbi:hypothetical protein XELAEV_18004738mg [Xenopus laevis]|uniref:Uncharacterized protein n=1 Tax=Xenopus laevis TaxID=8355 RepID=A0A974BQP2_XENLA|nr:hypothetical protein XELAEV_18004738mg [Xenopus laevis]
MALLVDQINPHSFFFFYWNHLLEPNTLVIAACMPLFILIYISPKTQACNQDLAKINQKLPTFCCLIERFIKVKLVQFCFYVVQIDRNSPVGFCLLIVYIMFFKDLAKFQYS